MNAARFFRALPGLALVLGLVLSLPAADTFTSVFISEVGFSGPKDEDGARPAWIELYNAGTWPVSLGGWFLTDDTNRPSAWRLPNVTLLPDKPLLIHASGKNRTNDLLHLHTGFSLNSTGGFIALVTAGTNAISEVKYPKLVNGTSFGSVRGEPGWRGAFPKATPGKANASRGPGFAPEVFFSRHAGNFSDDFTLTLTTRVTNTTNAVIRYTRDGTLPTSRSPAYDAPLLITNTAHLRARAFQTNALPGPPASVAYLKLFTNAAEFSSPLPVLVLDTFGKNLPTSDSKWFTHLALFEPVNGKTSLTNAPTLATRAGYRVRGSTSAGFPQTPFSVEFLDEFNEERALGLLGLPADADWVLYAPNAFDPVMIHNPFIYQLSRDLGRYSPRTRFVEVFLVKDAGRVRAEHYHGVYVLTEKIKIGRHRVNLDRMGAEDRKPPEVTGGYLLKFDRFGPGESGFWGGGERGLVHVEPKEQTMHLPQRAAQRDYLMGFMQEFNTALHGTNWMHPVTGYRAYLDVEAALDFHVLQVLSGNVDAMVLSTYFHKPRGGKIVCGPQWDFDRALGSTDPRDANPRQWNTGHAFFAGEWWARLCSDPDFWQQWADRWQELRLGHFSPTNLHGLIDRLADEVRAVQPREYERWGLQARGGSYQGEVDHMKNWLAERVDFIDRQFTPAPVLQLSGEVITFSAPTNATIYYTLDGTDPRLPQGALSSSALTYTNSFAPKPGAHVIARARDLKQRQTEGPTASTPWSGPVERKPASP